MLKDALGKFELHAVRCVRVRVAESVQKDKLVSLFTVIQKYNILFGVVNRVVERTDVVPACRCLISENP